MNKLLEYLRNFLQNDLLYQIILALLIIIGSIILAKIIIFIVNKTVKPLAARTKTEFDDKIIGILDSGIFRMVVVAGFYISLENIKAAFNSAMMNTDKKLIDVYPFLKSAANTIDYLLFIILVIILLLLSFRIVTVLFEWYANKINAEENRNLSGSVFPLLNKVSKILLTLLAVVIILSKFKIDISGLIVSLGVGSLAIALAAQETISNMIAGFIIMIDRPFRIGDRVRYTDTQVGDVVEIGIRSTKILDFDNNLVIIPNNEIIKSKIVNITYPATLTRVVVDVGVAYNSDVNKVKETLVRIANQNPLVSQDVPPAVFFMNFGESSIDFRLAVRTDDYKNAFELGSRLREAVLEAFRHEGIEIPFPQRVIYTKKEN